jgi:RNA polymerase sigma-70 factor (ECF subfamily)
MTEDRDEQRWVRSYLRTRSEADFRALYRAHTPALYGFALRLARGDQDEAQDIVQDTWMRAAARLDGFRWQSSLKTWLHAVVLNVHRERLRRRAVAGRHDGEVQRRFTVLRGDRQPSAIDLERAVRELPDGQRDVMVLHDVEGYTHEEIAAMAGIAVGTSKSQLSKARRTLRARLGGRNAGAGKEKNDHAG